MYYLRLLVASALVMAGATPAHAAPSDRHCAYRLEPLERTGRVVEARLVRLGCFETFTEAIEAGSGGTIQLTADVSPRTLSQSDLGEVTPLAFDVLIGTEYVDATYSTGSGSKSYFASETCSSTTTWEVPYVGDAWNDTFSSGKGFGGCDRNKKFEASNFGGTVLTCTPNCSFYGTMNDEVSSLRWRP